MYVFNREDIKNKLLNMLDFLNLAGLLFRKSKVILHLNRSKLRGLDRMCMILEKENYSISTQAFYKRQPFKRLKYQSKHHCPHIGL